MNTLTIDIVDSRRSARADLIDEGFRTVTEAELRCETPPGERLKREKLAEIVEGVLALNGEREYFKLLAAIAVMEAGNFRRSPGAFLIACAKRRDFLSYANTKEPK